MDKTIKINQIKNACIKHGITSYQIGKFTKISSYAAHKILMGETKNPNEATLDIILDYIKTKENSSLCELSIEERIADKVVERLLPHLLKIKTQLS